jgi:hypothetical protein
MYCILPALLTLPGSGSICTSEPAWAAARSQRDSGNAVLGHNGVSKERPVCHVRDRCGCTAIRHIHRESIVTELRRTLQEQAAKLCSTHCKAIRYSVLENYQIVTHAFEKAHERILEIMYTREGSTAHTRLDHLETLATPGMRQSV